MVMLALTSVTVVRYHCVVNMQSARNKEGKQQNLKKAHLSKECLTWLDYFLKTIPYDLLIEQCRKVCNKHTAICFTDLQTDYQRMNHYTKQGLIPLTSHLIGIRQDYLEG